MARQAQVSLSTVSRVLNNSPNVAPRTRSRVLQAIQALGYRPSIVASALTTKRTRTVGLLVPDITNPFFAEIARGAEDECRSGGFNLVMCNTDESPAREREYIDLLRRRSTDGLLFASAELDADHVSSLDGYPMVFISRTVEGLSADAVRVDDYRGGYLATRHLIDLGHRRIGLAAGPLGTLPSRERRRGYLAALLEAGIDADPTLMASGPFTLESGARLAERLLYHRPTALVCGNDLIAIGVMRAAREAGLRVPQDLSVVGYDNTVLAATADLTTVAQPMREMGRRAMQLLLEQMDGGRREPRSEVLAPNLVLGGTTGRISR